MNVRSSIAWSRSSARGTCLFEREHHRRIETVLLALDADRLLRSACLFGGGTAISLTHGEFRESVDIDLMTSSRDGYRELRQALTGPLGIGAITRPGHALATTRELRADQYGIRTVLDVDGAPIKFEIILEGRITFDAPGPADRVCGIATLTPLDMLATKLLANADRWADSAVMSRDLIDLAMMKPTRALLKRAIEKARAAYGDSVERDLAKAIEHLRERPQRLDACMQAMHITGVPKAVLWSRIKALAA